VKPLRQPKTLTLDGKRYSLVVPWKHIEGPISEGPFYRLRGDKSSSLFLPDARYLHTATGKLEFMHRIQS
jgi:hypothetical protein